jgi:cobalamin biosynthesis protein CobD/CbiB
MKDYKIDITRGIYPLATLIFLIIGFVWNLWHPGWAIFIFAWLLEEIVTYAKTGKLKISIYGIAAVIFLVLGFVFGVWSYSWLVFVAAWVIDEMVVPKKEKKGKKNKKENKDEIFEQHENAN